MQAPEITCDASWGPGMCISLVVQQDLVHVAAQHQAAAVLLHAAHQALHHRLHGMEEAVREVGVRWVGRRGGERRGHESRYEERA